MPGATLQTFLPHVHVLTGKICSSSPVSFVCSQRAGLELSRICLVEPCAPNTRAGSSTMPGVGTGPSVQAPNWQHPCTLLSQLLC